MSVALCVGGRVCYGWVIVYVSPSSLMEIIF